MNTSSVGLLFTSFYGIRHSIKVVTRDFSIVTTAVAVTGCSLWTSMANRASRKGVFYGFVSESDCTAVCLSSPICVAVDFGPPGCVIHNNTDDLTSAYSAPGVTQFVLNRHCLSGTPQLATTAPFGAANFTEATGIESIAT